MSEPTESAKPPVGITVAAAEQPVFDHSQRLTPEYAFYRGVRQGFRLKPVEGEVPAGAHLEFAMPEQGLGNIRFTMTAPAIDGEANRLTEIAAKYAPVAKSVLASVSSIHVGDADATAKVNDGVVTVSGNIAMDPEKTVTPVQSPYVPPDVPYVPPAPTAYENANAAVSFVVQAALEKANIQYQAPAMVWQEQRIPKKELVDRGMKQTEKGPVRDLTYEHRGNFDRLMKQVPGVISVPVGKISSNLADPITVPAEQGPYVEKVLQEALQQMGLEPDQYKILRNPEGRKGYVPERSQVDEAGNTIYVADEAKIVGDKLELKDPKRAVVKDDALYIQIDPKALADVKTLVGAKSYLQRDGSKTATMRAQQVQGYINQLVPPSAEKA